MNSDNNYIELNKSLWNKKTEVHLNSEFYNVEAFQNGKTSLNEIELSLLGDIKGKSVLHLQCHFGMDTLSLSRMGAEVVGVDFSEKAIQFASELAAKETSNARFICCNVYDLPLHLNETFDIVFTSYGTIGWLPDLDKWASIISTFLKPNGKFVFVEFHPVVWMFDDAFSYVQYNYFKADAIIETESGTYADRAADIQEKSVSWNHSLSEVFTSLLENELSIHQFQEYDYSPYSCFKNMVEVEKGKYRIAHLENKIPMVYALVAVKKNE